MTVSGTTFWLLRVFCRNGFILAEESQKFFPTFFIWHRIQRQQWHQRQQLKQPLCLPLNWRESLRTFFTIFSLFEEYQNKSKLLHKSLSLTFSWESFKPLSHYISLSISFSCSSALLSNQLNFSCSPNKAQSIFDFATPFVWFDSDGCRMQQTKVFKKLNPQLHTNDFEMKRLVGMQSYVDYCL